MEKVTVLLLNQHQDTLLFVCDTFMATHPLRGAGSEILMLCMVTVLTITAISPLSSEVVY